jgi:lauroyl/myristoyl acyltransferase
MARLVPYSLNNTSGFARYFQMSGNEVVTPGRCDARPAPPVFPADREPLCTANDLLWLLYLYPLRLMSAFAPRALLYWIGRLAEPWVQLHASDRVEKAVRWIVSARCSTPEQAPGIARQSISNNMFGILDDLLLIRPSFQKKLHCAGIQGAGHLDRALAAGKGVILLTGHFCANRIAERYLAATGYPMLSVHNRRPSNRAAGRLGRRILQPLYIELQQRAHPDVVYVQDPGCSLKILQRLRSGGLVNIQLDGVAGTRAVEGAFLGRSWRFPAGICDLVRLSGCAVVPMLCLGGSAGFRICFSPMLDAAKADSRDEWLAVNLPVFVRVLEKLIAGHPEEWRLWTHF